MKILEDMQTVTEIDWLIDQIVRNMPLGFEKLARSGSVMEAERQDKHKLDAMCKALKRRRELEWCGDQSHTH